MRGVVRSVRWLGCVLAMLLVACLVPVPAPAAAALGQEQKEEKKDKQQEGLPLKPERTVEFTTDEGTWLSLDVSPDGRTLVFELLGDLYTLPLAGGQATRITSGMAFDSQPRFSPDGKKIVFLSDRDGAENVWIANADGSEPKQLTKEQQSLFASPTWSPDGDYILVSRQPAALIDTYEVWMYHVKGGAGVQVTKGKANPQVPRSQWIHQVGAVPSPDGRYLYYTRRVGWFNPYNVLEFPLSQVARRDMVTGDEDILTAALGSGFRPVLSPDGNLLVYGTRYEAETGLRLRDLRTGEDRWLRYPVQRDDQESRFTRDFLPGYAFTPDGREVIVSYDGKIHRLNVATGEARPIPFTAQVSLELGPRLDFPARVEEGPVRARLIMQPVQSPDGKRLAFSAFTHLYVMDLPRGTPRRLTSAQAREFQPAWSPDGQWLAYVTWTVEGGHIWKVRAGGGAPQQLTRVAAFYRDPVWSPDGTRLVALRAPRQVRVEMPAEWFAGLTGVDLVWIPAEGGDARLILPSRGLATPHFSAEKDRVYVYAPQQGLISLRFDGTDRRTHIKVVGKKQYEPEPQPASDVRISPDGRQALARFNDQAYLVTIPRVGGEPPTINVTAPAVPIKQLSETGADYLAWADGGQTLTWAVGSTFFRQPVATVTFEPEKKEGEKKEGEKKEGEKKADGQQTQPEKKSLAEEVEVVVERPRHKPTGSIVLRGAQVISMRGDEVIPNADVVVTDNRIVAVGRRGRVAVPAGARIMDVTGSTIIPGLVDIHAHWFEIRRGVLDVQNWSFLANLAYGVTTGRDVQTGTNDMFAYQDLVDIGEILGPRAFSTGPGAGFWNNDLQSADEAKQVVARYRTHYRTNTLKSYMIGNRKQRQWMVMASKEHQVMPTTEGGLDLKLNLTHAIDGFAGNEHAFPIMPLYRDVAELVARSGMVYTPTMLVAYGGPWAENYFYQTTEVHDDPKLQRFIPHNILDSRTKRRPWFRYEEHVFPRLASSATKIIRAGGRVGIGGHGQLQGIQVHWEMWALAAGGATPLEVLRAGTLHGAEAIGYAQDVGSIEPGKLADLVILAKDPLKDIRNTNTIRYVMKNGELFEGDTLNQVWPQEKPLAPLWWWNDKP